MEEQVKVIEKAEDLMEEELDIHTIIKDNRKLQAQVQYLMKIMKVPKGKLENLEMTRDCIEEE